MNPKKRWIVIFVLSTLLPLNAHAFGRSRHKKRPSVPAPIEEFVEITSTDVIFGDAIFSGTGCGASSASSTLSPDSKLLSVLFDQFSVEAGQSTQRRSDQKNCIIQIPIQVPEGIQITIYKTDFRGFNALPSGGKSQLTLTHSLQDRQRNQSSPAIQKNFSGPLNEDFTLTDTEATFTSSCGGSMTLTLRVDLSVVTNKKREQSSFTLDSFDMTSKAGVSFRVRKNPC